MRALQLIAKRFFEPLIHKPKQINLKHKYKHIKRVSKGMDNLVNLIF